MKVADAQAESGGWLKTSAGGVHPDGRRRKWIVRWEGEGRPVLTVCVRRVRGTFEQCVPFKYVGFRRVRGDHRWG